MPEYCQNDTGQVLLNSASSAVGVGYDGNVASIIPLAMSGALNVPGQSGAFDIDYNGGTQTLVEDFTNKAAVRTALRIGSSIDNASINVPGTILPSTDAHTYFLGGGGGTLTINCALNNSGGPTATGLEMGTSGNLLPGHVILAAYENLYSGPTLIHAGTLQLVNVSAVGESSRMSVGTYSTGFNGIYTDAPADYFNGFGTLLLDPAVAYGGPVNAKTLDGGAVGWTAPKTLTALPGVYGATLLSKLANTAGFPAGVPTNILHLGGSGFITKRNWTITDNNGTPVALVKSGSCTLDLSQDGAMGANTYSGGTSILRGGIIVSAANQLGSGPIFLANVGLLRVTAPDSFTQTLKPYGDPLNGAGNGAGVISVDIGVTVQFVGAIDTSLSPQSLIEKQGGGDLAFTANNHYAYDVSKADCWGLMLTEGTVHVNQLPVDTTMENNQTGALVCNGGALIVEPATSSMHVPTDHANYGFSALASFQDTVSNLDVADGALLRITGRGASTLNGSIIVNAASGSIGTMELASDVSGSDTTGNGIIDLRGGTLKLTQLNNDINQTSKLILPQSTGFTLKLNGGTFIGNKDGCINGNLIINDSDPVGASHIQSAGTPLDANKLWVVGGSGLTSWSGTLEKDEPGTVRFDRFKGAPVTVDPTSNLLKITDGTFNAAGLGDPFTDTATGVSIEIQNDSTAAGLLISEGVKVVDNIYGTGNTAVIGPAGTELIVDSIVQNNLTLGADCLVTIRPIPGGHSDSYTSITPVPEPATWLLLVLAAAGLLSWRARRLLYKRGGWSI
jgi:autotransporter-associated beta strand protein